MKKIMLFAAVWLLACLSGVASAQNGWKEDVVSISGKVVNRSAADNNRLVELRFNTIFGDVSGAAFPNTYLAQTDGDGNFGIDIPVFFPQDFWLAYGHASARLICAPGDRIVLEIDAGAANNPAGNPDVRPIRVTDGNRAKDNRNAMIFAEEYNAKKLYVDFEETEKLSPDEHKAFVMDQISRKTKFLADFKAEYNTGEFFNAWAEDFIEHDNLNDLLSYEQRINSGSVDFLKDYDMDDAGFVSQSHLWFWQTRLPGYWQRHSPIQEELMEYAKVNDLTGAYRLLFKTFADNISGITRDVVMTYMYTRLIDANDLERFEALYDPATIENSILRNKVTALFSEKKKAVEKSVLAANLFTISAGAYGDFLGLLTARYPGRVIYIDFWAPWCAPCLKEMPLSAELQKEYEGRDVVFVFMANRCTEESWLSTIKQRGFTGEHTLLTDAQFDFLSTEWGIVHGIPHYTIIDRGGNVVIKEAPRPSEREALVRELDKLLLKD